MSLSILSKRSLQKCVLSFSLLSKTKGDNLKFRNLFICSRFQPICSKNNSNLKQYSKHLSLKNVIYSNFCTDSSENLLDQHSSTSAKQRTFNSDYIDCSDDDTLSILSNDMIVINDFITEEEEQMILSEVEPYLKRLRYESSHWDDAIHGYRETERGNWTQRNKEIIQRIRDRAFPSGVSQLANVHVLDLQKEGVIKPHVDAIKFCGDTIAGISLLSSCVMRLVNTDEKTKHGDILLKPRSLYIMKNDARYKFSHEILSAENSKFKDIVIPRDRRISVICRNHPQ